MRLTVLVAIISMTATGSMPAIARPPKAQTRQLRQMRQLKPTLPLRQMHQLTPTRQPIQIAKILQLHQQKLWPLEMRDVSLDLKAGLPPNSVECTCLKPVMT